MNKGFEVDETGPLEGVVYAPDSTRVCRCKPEWANRIAHALNSVPPVVDAPTVPGWYWFRKDEPYPYTKVVEVWLHEKMILFAGEYPLSNMVKGSWRGPLVDPWAGEDSHV